MRAPVSRIEKSKALTGQSPSPSVLSPDISPKAISDRIPPAKRGPDLRGKDLRNARLVDMRLQGADFEGADLRGADLRGADLFGARFRRTDLRGTMLDMNHVLEIWVPPNLPLEIVNQIRNFDFRFVTRREVAQPAEGLVLECPYRTSHLKPVLYEWGSRTWRGGDRWTPPAVTWTLEEIIGAVLSALECRHDYAFTVLPLMRRFSDDARAATMLVHRHSRARTLAAVWS